jgi:hypothetical protein
MAARVGAPRGSTCSLPRRLVAVKRCTARAGNTTEPDSRRGRAPRGRAFGPRWAVKDSNSTLGLRERSRSLGRPRRGWGSARCPALRLRALLPISVGFGGSCCPRVAAQGSWIAYGYQRPIKARSTSQDRSGVLHTAEGLPRTELGGRCSSAASYSRPSRAKHWPPAKLWTGRAPRATGGRSTCGTSSALFLPVRRKLSRSAPCR